MSISSFIKRYPVRSYFFLAFAISWGGSLAVLGPEFFQGMAYQTIDWPLTLLAMLLGPSVSGLILTRVVDGRAGFLGLLGRMRRWRVGWRWHLVAVLTFPVLISVVLLALSRFASPEFAPSFTKLGIIYGLLAGFFEEIGWMGYAYPKMRLRYPVLAASLMLGLAHGVWHIVADYFGSSRTLGGYWLPHFALMWCFAMVALRVIIVWVYENTRSVLLAQLAHASSTGFLIVLSPSPITPASETLWYGVYGILLWAVAAVIIVKSRAIFINSHNGGVS